MSTKCEVSSGADGSYVFYSVPVGQYTLVSSVHSMYVRMCVCTFVCVCDCLTAMGKGWSSRYELSTVSNLADLLVRCTGLLQGDDMKTSFS